MKSEIKKNVVLIILFIVMILFTLIPGIFTLLNNRYNGVNSIIWATRLNTIEHSINGLIPIGKEYYYIGITTDNKPILIRADKNWLKENFKDDGSAISEKGILTKGKKQDTSVEIYNNAMYYLNVLNDENSISLTDVDFKRYVDTTSYRFAVMSIILSIMDLCAGIAAVYMYKTHGFPKNRYAKFAILAFVCVLLYFELYVITIR